MATLELPAFNGFADKFSKYHLVPDNQGNFYIITVNNREYLYNGNTYYYFTDSNSSGDATITLTKYHITHGKKATVEKSADGALVTLPGVHLHPLEYDYNPRIAGHYLYYLENGGKAVYIIDIDNPADVRRVPIETSSMNYLYSGIYTGGVW